MIDANNPFNILNQLAEEMIETDQDMNKELTTRIRQLINGSEIVLFMKGNALYPQCGFSANTVKILNTFNKPFKTYNILSAPEIRQGLKDFSNWPTFPQLYVQGKLIGGNDIVTEMYEAGDLQQIIEKL